MSAEVKRSEKYLSASSNKFAKVYIKLTDSNNGLISPQNMHSTIITKSQPDSGEANNVYKVRRISLRSVTVKDKVTIEQLMSKAWSNSLQSASNSIANGAQLLAFNFTTKIIDAWNSISAQGESVISVDYIINLANRDPEYLSIPEIGLIEVNNAIKSMTTSINSCEFDVFTNTRVYITGYDDTKNTDAISQALLSAWLKTNPGFGFLATRLKTGLKVHSDFFDEFKKNVTRLSVWWSVDNAQPNELYFGAPKLSEIVGALSAFGLKQYDGVKYKVFNMYIGSVVESDALLALVQKAWKAENTAFDESAFSVMSVVQSQVNAGDITSKSLSSGGVNKVEYHLGVGSNSDSSVDVSDVTQPSKETIQKIASDLKLDIQVYSEQEVTSMLNQKMTSTKNEQVIY